MGFYEIAQKNLKKELLFLRETRDEMKNLPEGTIVRRDKASGPEYYIKKTGWRSIYQKIGVR